MRQGSCRVKATRSGLAFAALRHYVDCWIHEATAMTNGPNRILDEFAKLMTDAAGAAQGVRREVETAFRGQAEKILNSMDVVQREEFEAVREMAVKARAENKALAARIATLEARLAANLSENPAASTTEAAAKSRSKK
jgi:BMFP domain-containing protein YqiC